jgi:hypothetical protein
MEGRENYLKRAENPISAVGNIGNFGVRSNAIKGFKKESTPEIIWRTAGNLWRHV